MGKYEEIIQEFIKTPMRHHEQIKFFIRKRADLIQELEDGGQSFDKAKENPDVQLLEHKIEQLKRSDERSEKRTDEWLSRKPEGFGKPRRAGGQIFYPIGYVHDSEIQEDLKKEEQNKNGDVSKHILTLRQKALFLLAITYSRIELPQQVILEKVAKVFHPWTGGDFKKLKEHLETAAVYKSIRERGGRQSIINRIADLEAVLDQIRPLKKGKAIELIANEIKSLKDELDEG